MKALKDLYLLLSMWLLGRIDRRLMAEQMETRGSNILKYYEMLDDKDVGTDVKRNN